MRKMALCTGYPGIDDKTGGLRLGEVTVVAGRAAMGQTNLALNIALNFCKAYKRKVLYCAVMASKEDIMLKLNSLLSGIPYNENILKWNMPFNGTSLKPGWELFAEKMEELNALNLAIKDIRFIEEIEYELEHRRECELVIVDLLQGLRSKEAYEEDCDRDMALKLLYGTDPDTGINPASGIYLKKLKEFAKKYNVAVLVASTIPKSVDIRTDKTPVIGDLKDAGIDTKDIDNALLVYRENYYTGKIYRHYNMQRPEFIEGQAQIHIYRKGRKRGTETLWYRLQNMGFYCLGK